MRSESGQKETPAPVTVAKGGRGSSRGRPLQFAGTVPARQLESPARFFQFGAVNRVVFKQIELGLSSERLAAYAVPHGGAAPDPCVTLARYLLNMALCESLYSPLQLCEIALRNSIHRHASTLMGRSDWYDATGFPLTPWAAMEVKKAKTKITKAGKKLTDAGIAKISSGLLPAGILLLSSRAPVGYLAISAIPVAVNQGFIAMKCNDRTSNYFMLNWCQTNMGEIKSRATGTTFPEISKNSFRPISVIPPSKAIMAEFTAKVASIYAQITANLRQSQILATLRDALLPKLLSRQLGTGNSNEEMLAI